jgi:hypothetical protein
MPLQIFNHHVLHIANDLIKIIFKVFSELMTCQNLNPLLLQKRRERSKDVRNTLFVHVSRENDHYHDR